MTQEKRQAIRKPIGRLVYAEIGADNGSILLDISERGCSFQAIAPVRGQQLHFTISVGDGRKVTGNARVAWVDASQKVGGLRFLNDSPELREQIRSWMEITLAPESALRAGEQRESEAKLRRKKLREEARTRLEPVNTSPSTKSPLSSGATAAAYVAVAPTHGSAVMSAQMSEKMVLAVPGNNRSGVGLATMAIGLVALFATITVAYKQEIGHLVMRIGAGMTGEAPKPPAPPLDQSSVPSIPAETSVPATTSGLGEIGQQSPIDTEALSGKKQLTPVSDDPVPVSRPAVSRNADLTEDVPSLWTLVENGDPRAELTLADRYLRGEGVNQSCAQARVLLEAAAKRGSSEAQRKLDELPQAGCR